MIVLRGTHPQDLITFPLPSTLPDLYLSSPAAMAYPFTHRQRWCQQSLITSLAITAGVSKICLTVPHWKPTSKLSLALAACHTSSEPLERIFCTQDPDPLLATQVASASWSASFWQGKTTSYTGMISIAPMLSRSKDIPKFSLAPEALARFP